MRIGIDAIAFSTSKYFLSLETLARHRRVDYAKYCLGIGQTKMAVFPPNEDIVTIAVDAAKKVISQMEDKDKIDVVIFATESAFDISKSAGIYVHNFLGLRKDCRVFDLKQACYSAAAALQMAKSHVAVHPESKVLVIGSDIIKYSPGTSGEATQGGGAVAFIVSKNPRILEMEPYSGIHTEDIMDFWRPAYLKEALFDGKLSAHNYLKSLDICIKIYLEKANRTIFDINHVCFHAPFGKMAQKANNHLFKCKSINETLAYNSIIGNSCSASLFICFISLLDNFSASLAGGRIGFYSYGSGSVAEFFSGVVVEDYQKMLRIENNQTMLSSRHEISFLEYELLCSDKLQDFHYENIGDATLYDIKNDKRIYKHATSNFFKNPF